MRPSLRFSWAGTALMIPLSVVDASRAAPRLRARAARPAAWAAQPGPAGGNALPAPRRPGRHPPYLIVLAGWFVSRVRPPSRNRPPEFRREVRYALGSRGSLAGRAQLVCRFGARSRL